MPVYHRHKLPLLQKLRKLVEVFPVRPVSHNTQFPACKPGNNRAQDHQLQQQPAHGAAYHGKGTAWLQRAFIIRYGPVCNHIQDLIILQAIPRIVFNVIANEMIGAQRTQHLEFLTAVHTGHFGAQ